MVFFFLFRFSALIFMSYGLWRDRFSAPNLGIYLFMSLAVAVIFFLSILLFIRVFRSDFMTPAPQTDKTFQVIKEGLVIPGVTPLPQNNLLLVNDYSKASGDTNAAKKIISSSSSASSVTSSSDVSFSSNDKTVVRSAVST
jgi:hypothetical protein